MDIIHQLFNVSPFIALFITLSLGYLVGKISIGRFIVGGVAGTLIAGLIIGQFGVNFDHEVKSIFFALFIYAVGYQGGEYFLTTPRSSTLKIILSAVVMTVSGLLCVLIAAQLFGLDQGTAAGLAAGGLTQSAIIISAGEAINHLGGISADAKQLLQQNLFSSYAVTYIFGLLGPILMITWIIPSIMKWDIREQAILLANSTTGGKKICPITANNTATALITRAFKVNADSTINGMPFDRVNEPLIDACIELIERDGRPYTDKQPPTFKEGDVLIISARSQVVYQLQDNVIGLEVEIPDGIEVIEESRQLVVNNPQFIGQPLHDVKQYSDHGNQRGVYVTNYTRAGRVIDITPELIVEKNDIIELTGSAEDINRVESNLGKRLKYSATTDFVMFGFGIVMGLLIGMISFKLAGTPITIGVGIGCLITGLCAGWLRGQKPHLATMPAITSTIIRDLSLAVFIAIISLEAAPLAIESIREHGIKILLLGIAVTLIPQVIGFLVSYYLLKIKNPIESLSCLAGGRNAKPAFAALIEKTGNTTPVFAFSVTFAVSSILLTLCGPIIVTFITLHTGM